MARAFFICVLIVMGCFAIQLEEEMISLTSNKAYEIDHQPMIDSMKAITSKGLNENPFAASLIGIDDLIKQMKCDLEFISNGMVVVESDFGVAGGGIKDTLQYLIDSNTITITVPDSDDFILMYSMEEEILRIDSTSLVLKEKAE